MLQEEDVAKKYGVHLLKCTVSSIIHDTPSNFIIFSLPSLQAYSSKCVALPSSVPSIYLLIKTLASQDPLIAPRGTSVVLRRSVGHTWSTLLCSSGQVEILSWKFLCNTGYKSVSSSVAHQFRNYTTVGINTALIRSFAELRFILQLMLLKYSFFPCMLYPRETSALWFFLVQFGRTRKTYLNQI